MVPGLAGVRGLNRLGVRLVLLLGIALLPVGLIAMYQTYRVMEDAKTRVDSALLGESIAASAGERRMITRIMGLTEALALMLPRLSNRPDECNAYMANVVSEVEIIVFAGFTDMDGVLACASRGAGMQVGSRAQSQAATQFEETRITVSENALVTDLPALLLQHPVRKDGEVTGYVTVTLPFQTVTLGEDMLPPAKPVDVITFDASGTPLTSELEKASLQDRLPAHRDLASLALTNGTVFDDVDGSGARRIYSVVPVVPDQLFALGVWPERIWRVGLGGYLAALAFPALMWLASLLVAYFAVHRLVIRHIRTLQRNIRSFGAVRRVRAVPDAADLPVELREVTEAFQHLTDKVTRDEAEQENMLHEKDVLLKEVHHRVKNNLQLIASITNMQIRRARHGETKFMLRRLQDRVMSLATVHRNLYQASVLSEVRADELIADLARPLSRSASLPEQPVDFSIQADPVLLYPDQAVPLSLLVTEAITNAYKYIGRPQRGLPWVSLTLRNLENREVELAVRNSIGPALSPKDEGDTVSGLGSQLIGAFVMQLGGTHTAQTVDDAFEVRVVFSRADFTLDSGESVGLNAAQ